LKVAEVNNNIKILGTEGGFEYSVSIKKYGPVVMKKDTNNNITYSPLKDCTIDNITLEQAKELASYPKQLGKYKNFNIMLKKGKFGLYITYGHNGQNKISVKDEVTLNEAIELIKQYETKDKNIIIDGNNTYKILNGKYGHYIQHLVKNKKSNNVKIPDGTDVTSIDLATIKKIINDNKKKPKKFTKKSN
jgi:DNA topoisomerase I